MKTLMKKKKEKTSMFINANNKSTNRPISLVESMNYERCKKLITKDRKEIM